MTNTERDAFLAELERRFRARTPSMDILSALAPYRVGRSEMRAWFDERFGRSLTFDEETGLQALVTRLYRRLKREFPQERWT